MKLRSSARRQFLRGVGVGAFALPFLRHPRAALAAPPRRLMVFHTACGTVMKDFWPAAPEGPFGRILQPLEPVRSKLTVMRGINMDSAYKSPVPRDHLPDNNNALTARQAVGSGNSYNPGGISVDQHIANAIGAQTKFPSLQLGVKVGGYCQYIASRGAGQGIFPENNAQKAFDRLFKDAVPGGTPADLERLRAEKRSLLDLVTAELQDVRCALGAAERPTFEAHLDSLRDLERAIAAPVVSAPSGGGQCAAPPAPAVATDLPTLVKQQIDVAVAALACDLTRVITLQVQNGASGQPYPFLGMPAYSHHGISHNSEGVNEPGDKREEWLVQIENWNAQQFHYLVGKLAAINEAGSSLLDSAAAIWTHEQSNGGSHSRRDMPYVLAGSCGGAFKTGRLINLGGRSHSGLLISLANAMGVPTETFGDPDFSKGPLVDL
jgi:Protein of unknown function (DUF1552)